MDEVHQTILIADDSPDNIALLTEILKPYYGLLIATDGEKAVQLIQSEKRPDLILLDIIMPQLDGFEVCKRVKSNPETTEIPVIFITGLREREEIIRGFTIGAQDYVTKPFHPKELLARIKTHLDLKSRTEELKSLNATLEKRVNLKTKQIREANKKLKELNEALEKANQQLLTLDRAKSKFIQIISHEIRTPLTGIMGFTELLQNSLKQSQYDKYFNALKESVYRLDEFAERALFISNLMAGIVKPNFQDITFNSLFQHILLNFNNAIQLKKLKISNKVPDSFTINADYDLAQIVLFNLMDNAIKFSPPNAQIVIRKSGKKTLEIINTDSQFSEEALQNLFKLFGYGYEPIDQNFGLGLAISKMIMDLQDGKIEVSNLKGNNACVILHFK